MADVRDVVFLRVGNIGTRKIMVKAFRHLHELSLQFHINNQPGETLRIMDKGKL
jgi:ABC-type transport system involved in Fe-S cluster assembly fused permease/ATPase subunit